jgi:signal transduction histidine kinase
MRRRITWLVVATTSTVVASFVIPLCLLVQMLAEDRAMATADQEARNVAILATGVEGDDRLASLLAGLGGGETTTSVLTAGGRQLGGGPPMADDPLVRRALGGTAFREVGDEGGAVLLPVVVADGTAVVRTTVDAATLRDGVPQAWAGIIGLGLVLLAASVAIAMRLGRRVSEPLLEVAGTAHRLREGDLAARADVRGTEETRELARALNGLAERTTELLAAERAVVGDLAHRLRTPVTALRLDAEAVPDAELRQRLGEHVAVLQRTVDAIVREARRPVRTDLGARCDAAAVVGERVAFWRPLAEDQDRDLTVALVDGPLRVALAEEDLRDLVDVVVDNVFAHTPEGTALRVTTGLHGAGADARLVLAVADAGPGFAAERTQRPGTTGLGLDIAARTAEGVGGTLRRGASPTGGALVEVELPVLED